MEPSPLIPAFHAPISLHDMSTLPKLITNAWLASQAAPDETHMVRVIARNVVSSVGYRLRCKNRTYVFERDGKISAHVLDVPISVWMREVPAGAYRPNMSISHDVAPTPDAPLTIQVLPLRTAQSTSAMARLAEVARLMGAPPAMMAAIDAAAKGDVEHLDDILAHRPPDSPPAAATASAAPPAVPPAEDRPKETPRESAARRARESRARKKEARQAAAATVPA